MDRLETDHPELIWPWVEEQADALLTANGVWLPPQQARERVAAALYEMNEAKFNLALEAVGNEEVGTVRSRRWKECAKKMRRIARMLGRRCDLAEERARVAERKVERVRRWAKVWAMHTDQRAALKQALDGDEFEGRARK